jgi:hypothetical protein
MKKCALRGVLENPIPRSGHFLHPLSFRLHPFSNYSLEGVREP